MKESEKIRELFSDFDTDTICVSDCEIITDGIRVDNIYLTEDGDIQIWAGDLDDDDSAEEIIVTEEERVRIFGEIIENL